MWPHLFTYLCFKCHIQKNHCQDQYKGIFPIFSSRNFMVLYLHLWRSHWQPTPVLLPGKSHGWRSLVGWSPWGRQESDRTEWLHFHFSLSCIGEGNGNPLQGSCLENPRDGGAWWAAIYGVTESWTQLKLLSSSSIYILNLYQVNFGACKIRVWLHSFACEYPVFPALFRKI